MLYLTVTITNSNYQQQVAKQHCSDIRCNSLLIAFQTIIGNMLLRIFY